MTKFLLFLLCAVLLLAEPITTMAESTAASETLIEAVAYPRVPRPVYKRYRGNSRGKHIKPGFFKRMALRRKAKQKKAANGGYIKSRRNNRSKGVIRVDAPVGTMPKPQQ